MKEFGPESIKLAAKYLEIGAVSWARGRACVNCHTTGKYLTEYTAWSKQLGKPSEEVHASFVKAVPKEVKEVKETEKEGHKYYPGTFVQRVAEYRAGRVGSERQRQALRGHGTFAPRHVRASMGKRRIRHLTTKSKSRISPPISNSLCKPHGPSRLLRVGWRG